MNIGITSLPAMKANFGTFSLIRICVMHHMKDQGSFWHGAEDREKYCKIMSSGCHVAICRNRLCLPARDHGIDRASMISGSYLVLRSNW